MKSVVVTGASRGLGLAISRRLVDEGYRVVAVARSVTEDLTALENDRPDAVSIRTFDLEQTELVADFARAILKDEENLYGLVNNAGIGTDGVLATMHLSDIERLIKINLTAPILMTKFLVRPMLMKRQGRIVNIGSIMGQTGYHGLAVYGATKAGLEGFTRSLSREAGKLNVTVNTVAPGYMETDMTAGLEGDKLNAIRRRAPLGLPKVAQVAGAVSYLLSDSASAVTGTTLTVDGGATA